MTPMLTFFMLQAVDVLTTLVGLRLGASEANPLVRLFLGLGPITGLILVKLAGFTLILVAFVLHRGPRLVRKLNWLYAGLGLWNLGMIAKAVLG